MPRRNARLTQRVRARSAAPKGSTPPATGIGKSAAAASISEPRSRARRGLPAVPLAPCETLDGVADGRVFAADPAGIAQLVDPPEQIFPADLAGARLIPGGYVGALHM